MKLAHFYKHKTYLLIVLVLLSVLMILVSSAFAQDLESPNYRIEDPSVNSGGGISDGNNGRDILTSAAQTGADTRLESSSYALRTGFPNGIQANVPTINCIETNTDSTSTNCQYLPNSNGMIGECGSPGCYDRAKIEINDENNPVDTLYLVSLSDDGWATSYYLQSDHTIDTTFDINDYMTQCTLEGRDPDDANCDDSSDTNWNESLQSNNIYGLKSGTTYQVRVRAVSGDFTETQYSPIQSTTTELPTLTLDLDIAATDIDTSAPNEMNLGTLRSGVIIDPDDDIWVDISTNTIEGTSVYVQNNGQGLYSSATTESIPSETEDLSTNDGDGGYGLKTISSTQASLGPLQEASLYNTSNTTSVGNILSTENLIFFTDTTGTNDGPITDGRGRTTLKAKSFESLAAGEYSDTITFTATGNW
jgi:hypothetical protein